MSSQHFFLKLIGPRPTFPMDITEAERALMQQHAAYLNEHFAAGRVLVYGPVMAATGAFGMGVIETPTEEEARQIMDADPSVKAGLNTYEVSPMRVIAARAL